MNNSEILAKFKDHLVADGKASKTVVSYTGDIQAFLTGWKTRRSNSQAI